MTFTLQKDKLNIAGRIKLSGSKSISNRALIIRALCRQHFPVERLANAKDTQLIQGLIRQEGDIFDAGAAGTTFRFMTAFLAAKEGTQILTGTERMKQRPVEVLVDALRHIGADIEYLEKAGYPPLKINTASRLGTPNTIEMPASTSSQYISALLMLAPTLPQGLTIHLKGKVVSRPYIEMTLNLMEYFGVHHSWAQNTITVHPQAYQPRPFVVEADWSAASYYYSMAAFAEQVDLQLDGLFENSLQGDAVLAEMMTAFGIKTTFNETGVHLSKSGHTRPALFEWDFLKCPDLAQTLAVTCAGTGVSGQFTGLETLRIKETDRIQALQNELAKVEVSFDPMPSKHDYYSTLGQVNLPAVNIPVFDTYEDHRMAMAFAPLGMLGPIKINEPMVVEKSYPQYWKDLQSLGFTITPA
jgi:3-phosphoshikimate 1-carboxyvinyltransferase